ncbi:DUF3127 domain-containing protein [Psychroserpens ponticola]|uniref:DUF3127 domain-containing protein n=1 Tax=Psychroserpens ponticola TaxID=2932268 RepID=A0ABY7RXQ8_9FLAO|nr:DUF3127 domain-containing protein [Psychroserpens ponticola]WCO01729.1 DUF3127 domain-containing protein [Psychroserpens ponticola]
MTQKEEFINHISFMDTKSLETVLVENAFKKYANTSFIEKLNKLFAEFKTVGNTRLEAYKGIGICECNKDKKVFCFVGDKTKDYFTLSYLENEKEYYKFSTSCSEVSYDEKLDVNNFHHFSIKPENTSEYKNHKQTSCPIKEYTAFCSKVICNMNAIEIWLEKHKDSYSETVALLKENTFKLNLVELAVKKEFEILYGKLNVLSILHKKEAYFKQQIKDYNEVKDSISRLKNWFDYQAENKNKYQLFSDVFYNNRTLTHYSLKIDELTLNPEDFKHTLKYLSIIEDSQAVVFEGTVKTIGDLYVHIESNNNRAYSKRKIVLSINDFCCSEYLITFSDGRVKHLDNLSVGQFVKVFARLTGGELQNSEGTNEYRHNLYGWRVEKLDAKPKVKKNTKEMDLYYKYILPLPF